MKEVDSVGRWLEQHSASYYKAKELGLLKTITLLMNWRVRKSQEEWYDILVNLRTKPPKGTTEFQTLNRLQKDAPELYKKLLKINSVLVPITQISYEVSCVYLATLQNRPKDKSKDSKTMQSIKARRPDLYLKLLEENPNLIHKNTRSKEH